MEQSTQPFRAVFIALGSNLGNPEANLKAAVQALRQSPALENVRASRFTRTSPVGPIRDQPDFLNGVVAAQSAWEPERLLGHLHALEATLGLERQKKIRQGPRLIDLDLLIVGELVCHSNTLTLPHPRMTERRFVLEPLAQLAPAFRHPVSGQTISALLEALP